MIAAIRSLIASLEQLPESSQEEAARRMEPIVDELVDRQWEEQLVKIPGEAWDKLDEQLAQDRAQGHFKQLGAGQPGGARHS